MSGTHRAGHELGPQHDSLVAILRSAAEMSPQACALVCESERLTYREYWSSAYALAVRLLALGARGQRVAVLLPNGIDICIASFGVQAAGAQLVPLNPLYTAHELRVILDDASPVAVIHAAEARSTMAPLLAELGIAHSIEVGEAARLAALTAAGAGADLPPLDPAGFAMLQYTGGTSGRPKGVNQTHQALATNVAQREAILPTSPERERVLAITPLYHAYASAMGLYLAASCRGTLVILPRYTPDSALGAIAAHRITLFLGSPTIYSGLIAHEATRSADLSSLRLCYSGSAALSAETLRGWEALSGCGICEGYGMTEGGPVLTFNPERGVRKPASVGIPLPQTEIEIVDVETGTRALPQGETGEIRARGPQIMAGYRNRPAETAAALREGWLYTGDIGMIDPDGYLFIRDRKKEMVIVSGFNVYPREVEEALYAHGGVLEAAVIGRPDERRGEAVVAFVVSRPGVPLVQEDLAEHLARQLVRYKIPSEIRIVPGLPKTAVGKIDKLALRSAN